MSVWVTALAFLLIVPIGWLLARTLAVGTRRTARSGRPVTGTREWKDYAAGLSEADRTLVVRSSRRGQTVPPSLAGAAVAYCQETLGRLDDRRQRSTLYAVVSLVAGVGAVLVGRTAQRPEVGVIALIALAVVLCLLIEISARLLRRKLIQALDANETSPSQ